MTTQELIEALRSKQSRDNRELLDEAADRLEELETSPIDLSKIKEICGVEFNEAQMVLTLYREGIRVGDKNELEWFTKGYKKAVEELHEIQLRQFSRILEQELINGYEVMEVEDE